MSLIDEVIKGHERGWSFTPLNGKVPLNRGWQAAARESLDEASQWAASGNVGLRTGSASGVVVIDVDDVKALTFDLPRTVIVATGGGGTHHYYRVPDGLEIGNHEKRWGLPKGVNVRGDGGQVVFVGSKHPDTGKTYEWLTAHSPDEVELAAFPLELFSAKAPAAKVAPLPPPPKKHVVVDGASPVKRAAAYLQHLAPAVSGQGGHVATFRAACECIRFGLSDSEARYLLDGYNQRCDPPWSAHELDHKIAEARKEVGGDAGKRLTEREAPPATKPIVRPSPASYAPLTPVQVYVPGNYVDETGQPFQVSNARFVDQVGRSLPAGMLYTRCGVVGELVGEKGSMEFSGSSDSSMRVLIDRVMQLHEPLMFKGKPSGQTEFVPCSRDMASLVLGNLSRANGIRPINRITGYPVFNYRWAIAQPGWNEGGLYFDESAELANLEPENDVETIVSTLDDLVVDFPFKGQSDRENFFGLLLTPLVEPALESNRPLHLVMSSLERTGKTKLIEDVFGGVLLGGPLGAMQLGNDEAEHDKRIVSLLKSGRSLVHLDNLKHFVDSAPLASLFTGSRYRGRLLGSSNDFEADNNMTVVGSGNNVQATGEIAKRIVLIELQPTSDSPETREDFQHHDIRSYVRQNRRRVLACLLGMVQNWRAAGGMKGKHTFGGFEAWAGAIGGILTHHGYTRWMCNRVDWAERANPDLVDLRALVTAWHDTHAGRSVSARDVMAMARGMDLFMGTLSQPTDHGQLLSFTRCVLRRFVNQPVGGLCIRMASSGSNTKYHVEPHK